VWSRLLLVALVFSIPFHLDKNFYRMHVEGRRASRSVTDLVVLAILATASRRRSRTADPAHGTGGMVDPSDTAFMLCGVLSLLNADHPTYVCWRKSALRSR
jgi:hypothetical protein